MRCGEGADGHTLQSLGMKKAELVSRLAQRRSVWKPLGLGPQHPLYSQRPRGPVSCVPMI